MSNLDEIAVAARSDSPEYTTTTHDVKLPDADAPEVTAELVIDRSSRMQARLTLHGIGEKQRLDDDGNPVLDDDGSPVMDPADVVHYLSGTFDEWRRIESALDATLASQARDAIGQLWCCTK